MKEQKGITLIALVITIIVLLLLAGVSISMISGENGILKQATQATTKTENQSTEEQIKLSVVEAMIEGENYTIIEDAQHLKKALENKGYKNATVTGTLESGYIVKIEDKEYNIGANGVLSNIDNSPIIADEEETAKWLYSTYDAGEGIDTGEISLVGYLGDIPDDGILKIPGVLTINGQQKEVVRIVGCVFSTGTNPDGTPDFNTSVMAGYVRPGTFLISNPDIIWSSMSNKLDSDKAENVKRIVISNGIKEIGYEAFSMNSMNNISGLTNLESVSIPSSIIDIGYFAFENCRNLKNVEIGSGFKGKLGGFVRMFITI